MKIKRSFFIGGFHVKQQKVEEAIRREAERLEFSLDDGQVKRLYDYHLLLEKWGKTIRLTGSLDGAEIVRRHLGDALILSSRLRRNGHYIDVGSGGGLPGIPLLALLPESCLTLVEVRSRKAAFLRTAVHELQLKGDVIDKRLEDYVDEAPLPFDAAWSLATFAPEEWIERARPLISEKGSIFVFVARSESIPSNLSGLKEVYRNEWQLSDGSPRLMIEYKPEA